MPFISLWLLQRHAKTNPNIITPSTIAFDDAEPALRLNTLAAKKSKSCSTELFFAY